MVAGGVLLLSAHLGGQELVEPPPSLTAIAREIAGDSGSTFERTSRLVGWINTQFEWSASDYQRRSVEQVVNRRAGNCAELAKVLRALLDGAGIRSRWVAEINIQPPSEQRQANAASKIAQWGNRGSVFGRMHNDHRWLEVYDPDTASWFPADPAVGVVGTDQWVAARLQFGLRPASPVPAIAETTRQMIVPFVVVAYDQRGSSIVENRSEYYLIDQFDRSYGNSLSSLPAWRDWVGLIGELSSLGSSALSGSTNLHDHERLIECLARVYHRLMVEEQGGGADAWSMPHAVSLEASVRPRPRITPPRQDP